MPKLFIEDIDLKGKRALIRVDFNVPMEEKDGQMVITDATRIVETLPTLRERARETDARFKTSFSFVELLGSLSR